MRALIVGLLLTGLALAGCIGDDDDVDGNGNGGNGGDGGGGSSSDPGSIFGRIVDGGLDPVARADVLLLDQGGAKNIKNTTTGADGNYRLDDVPAAEYRLVIESVCCKRGQESVAVVEGEELELDIQLERLPDPDASYIGKDEWTGFISCSLSYTTSARPATCTPGDTDPNRDDVHDFDADAGLYTIVVAMEWSQSPTSTEDNLRNWILWYDEDRGEDGGYQSMSRHMAPSPIEYRWEYDEPTQEPRDFQFRIYGGCCTVIPINNGLTAQQEFTVYWHLFYGERAPEGYSALPDA